jgi:hypothetical protein
VRIDTNVPGTQWAIQEMQVVAGDYKLWIDGDLEGTDTRSNTGFGWVDRVGQDLIGHISEVLIFDGALSSDDRQGVGAYLADKYGIASSYTGGFGVDFGNVQVDAGATLLNSGSGALSVNNVAGGGTIQGDVIVRGDLAPGDSVGSLDFDGNLTLEDGAGYLWELGGTTSGLPGAGVAYDSVPVVSDLTFDGAWTLVLQDADGSADPGDLFYLFTGFSGSAGNFTPLLDAGMVDLSRWDLSNVSFGIDPDGLYMTGLSVEPASTGIIPEPSTLALLALSLPGLMFYNRRRSR